MNTPGSFERFGDPRTFCLEAMLLEDQSSDEGAPADAIGSLGRWRLHVAGQNLCAHESVVSAQASADAVTWYLAPLAHWIAQSWAPLLHEERLPGRGTPTGRTARDAYAAAVQGFGDDGDRFAPWQHWAARHSLRWASAGAVLPDVFLRRLGDDLEIAWGDRVEAGGEHVTYLAEPAAATVPVADAAAALDGFLLWFVGRHALAARPWLPGLRTAVEARPRQPQTALAWHLDGSERPGPLTRLYRSLRALDTDGEGVALGPLRVLDPLSPAVAMFGALSPAIDAAAAARLLAHVDQAAQAGFNGAALETHVRDAPALAALPPWGDGYRLAQDFADAVALRATEDERIDIGPLLERLGIQVTLDKLGAEGPRGVAIAGPDLRPTIVINRDHDRNRSESGRRFTMAHELCHLLHDRGRARRVSHASTPWAPLPVEQRANAFAAMLLMPPELVRRIFVPTLGRGGSEDAIRDAARRLRVSVSATRQHLANLGEVGPVDRERLS